MIIKEEQPTKSSLEDKDIRSQEEYSPLDEEENPPSTPINYTIQTKPSQEVTQPPYQETLLVKKPEVPLRYDLEA